MSTEIKVPTLGESVTEATVLKWHKQVGEAVETDEPVVELETEKVTVEIRATAAGTVDAIIAAEGAEVRVGAILGVIGTARAVTTVSASPVASHAAATLVPQPRVAASKDTVSPPSVLRLVDEHSHDPKSRRATGKSGIARVDDKADVIAPISAPSQPVRAAAVSERPEERVPMSRLRKRIAERLKEAQNTAAMLSTFNEADMSALIALRDRHKESFEKKHGVKMGFMSFFVKACVTALRELPAVNAQIQDDDIVYKKYYDIGVAVATPQGLVVPIVRNCDVKSLAQIETEISNLGAKAREGKLSVEDMTGGTFTISNGGIYGSMLSTPILNVPQSGILGMHRIKQRAVVLDDGRIVARPIMYLALSYDHRIIDGREAVTFLMRVKENIEEPSWLLLDA